MKYNRFSFTLTNKSGFVSNNIIPCDDWLQVYRIKSELLKSNNIIKVDCEKYSNYQTKMKDLNQYKLLKRGDKIKINNKKDFIYGA